MDPHVVSHKYFMILKCHINIFFLSLLDLIIEGKFYIKLDVKKISLL